MATRLAALLATECTQRVGIRPLVDPFMRSILDQEQNLGRKVRVEFGKLTAARPCAINASRTVRRPRTAVGVSSAPLPPPRGPPPGGGALDPPEMRRSAVAAVSGRIAPWPNSPVVASGPEAARAELGDCDVVDPSSLRKRRAPWPPPGWGAPRPSRKALPGRSLAEACDFVRPHELQGSSGSEVCRTSHKGGQQLAYFPHRRQCRIALAFCMPWPFFFEGNGVA